MSEDNVIEDIKDTLIDIIGPEYHRLSKPGIRYHLGTIEIFLGAVASAFLLPYLKKLAEKTAEATWNALFQPTSGTEKTGISDAVLLQESKSLIQSASESDEAAARSVAQEELRRFLEENKFPGAVQTKVVKSIVLYLEEARRIEKES